MKNAHAAGSAPKKQQRLTRAERRAAERERLRRQKTRQSRALPVSMIVGVVITVLAIAAIAAYALIGTSRATSKPGLADPNAMNPGTMLHAGNIAPHFTLKDLNGKSYTLAAQRGHPVLLEFFATWCPVCQAEAPVMAKLTKNYQSKGVRVWSVMSSPYGRNYEDSGRKDLTLATASDLNWYAKQFNVRHPQLVDPSFSATNRYGVSSTPGIFVVDSAGMLSYAQAGERPYAEIARALNSALKGGM